MTQSSPTAVMYLMILLTTILIHRTTGYCAGLGANPGFKGPPIVEQVTLTSVRVTWSGLVTRGECADQFIVKSWLARNPNDYKMSDLLPTSQYSWVVKDLVPNQDYVFQAIAREDKGILGKDWNKSDKTYFRTTSTNPTVEPETEQERNYYRDRPASSVYNSKSVKNASLGVFTMAGIIIGSLLGVLIIVGGVWNIIKHNRSSNKSGGDSDTEDTSDTDSMDLDLTNTDLESRMGDRDRPPSRARSYSYRSRRRSPMSVRTARTWSPSPPESIPDDSDK